MRTTLLLLFALSACRASSPAVPTAEPSAARLHADVAWLADDAREGRRAGTAGEAASAEWIAARFVELGLEPAGEDGSFFQSFTVPLPPVDGGTSRVSRAGAGELGRVEPLFCSEGGAMLGPLLFAGYGIVLEEENWDDYAGLDAENKVVLIVRGTPRLAPAEEGATGGDGGEGTGRVSKGDPWTGRGSIFHKVMEAKRRGAVAVLLAPHPDDEGAELLRFDTGGTARAGIPSLMVDVATATGLMPEYAVDVRHIDAREARSVLPEGPDVGVFADIDRGFGTARNVLARLPGVERGRAVVLGAHFDHLGHGGEGSLDRNAAGQIHNGADDNASGTAVVLELARLLVGGETPPADVVFALWSGEELGLLGSEYWVENPTMALGEVVTKLNFDMVGRADDGVVQVLGAGSAEPFTEWLDADGPAAGLNLKISSSGKGMGGSDHQSFLRSSIPALHFFSGVHTDYHKPTDDVERFEADGAAAVARLAYGLVWRTLGEPTRNLAFLEPKEEEAGPSEGRGKKSGFSVWLGSVPAYSYDGVGVLLSGTSEGSPAQRAGLLEGDIIRGLGDVDIDSIYDLVFALQHYKPGDVILARYLRDGVEESVRMTLSTRSLE